MFLARKTSNWKRAEEICATRRFSASMLPDRLAVLDSVWKKEFGRLAQHCSLLGVDGSYLVVKPASAAAASEINLRGPLLVKAINKYFKRPWLKAVRTATRL
jgi:hypothetical protein